MNNTDFLKLNVPQLSDLADVTKLSDNMEWIDNAVKQLSELHAIINQRLATLESDADDTDDKIAVIKADLMALGLKVNDNISRLTAVEAKANSTQASLIETKTDVNTVTRNLDAAVSRINEIETELHADTTKLNALSAQYLTDIQKITSDITVINSKIADIERVHTIDIARVETALEHKANTCDVDALERTVNQMANDKASAASVTALQASVEELNREKASKESVLVLNDAVNEIRNDKASKESIIALQAAINNKVDKEAGKGLSTNDYTNEEKSKLASVKSDVDSITGFFTLTK